MTTLESESAPHGLADVRAAVARGLGQAFETEIFASPIVRVGDTPDFQAALTSSDGT
jgi:hypothetical protein